MLARVVHAPVNLYFDITPLGRILNKFSKDLNNIETQMGWLMGAMLLNSYSLVQVFVVAIYAVWWVGIIIPFMVIFSGLLVANSAKAIKETARLQNTTKSPILSALSESIQGASTIRAFNRQTDFVEGFHSLLNKNILAVQVQVGVQNWFSIRVDFLAILLMLSIAMICIFARRFTEPIVLSMLLTYVI